MADNNIKIAVRVRPFNEREKDAGAALVVKMDGKTTHLLPPPSDSPGFHQGKVYDTKSFTFDYSFWTHDGYEIDAEGRFHPSLGSSYIDQDMVYDELGRLVMENAWKGFNTSLLAYGQTGSGKSYSMFGYGVNKGLIPMFCDELFKRIEKEMGGADNKIEFKVSFSMLEIYQDKVRDLLSDIHDDNLKVRNHPKLGFYVEDLKSFPVKNYAEIERLSEMGTRNRTVAATRMNATSSRSHTIIMITLQQINRSDNTEKRSVINLVDLAGSERQTDTQTDGSRLKEGININSSLTVLGQVISGIIEKQRNPKKNIVVPYRDSTLTKLLANSLGGNSKTIMIGAISPSCDAYEETLSTLRFLDRAKGIKNVAVVNENPIDKLIRELREENERLQRKLKDQNTMGLTPDSIASIELRNQIKEQERALAELNRSWAMKLEETILHQQVLESELQAERELAEKKRKLPYLININEDPFLSGMITHFIEPGAHLIGRGADVSRGEIKMSGLSILANHATIVRDENSFVTKLRPNVSSARIRLNGRLLIPPEEDDNENADPDGVTLEHNDRILFGLQQLFIFKMPGFQDKKKDDEITWNFCQREIAKAEGYGGDSNSKISKALVDEVTEVLSAVQEANAIAEELMVPKRYTLIINKQAEDDRQHTKQILSKQRFLAMQDLMSEMYAAYIEGGGLRAIQDWPKEKNPFELGMQDWLIGSSRIGFKQLLTVPKLSYTTILENVKGANEGLLKATIELMVDGVDDLLMSSASGAAMLGKEVKIRVAIHSVTGLRWSKGGIYCSYYIMNAEETDIVGSTVRHKTKLIDASSSNFDDVYVYSIPNYSEFINQNFSSYELLIDVYGEHDEKALQARKFKSMKRKNNQNAQGGNNPISPISPEKETRARAATAGSMDMRSVSSLVSLEKIENQRQQDLEEIEVFKKIISDAKVVDDNVKSKLLEEVRKFRKMRQLKPQLDKALNKKSGSSNPASPPPEEEEELAATKILLDKIEDVVKKANSKEDNDKLKSVLLQELNTVDLPSTSPEMEDKVRRRRNLENMIFDLRNLKDEEQGQKAKTFDILDKCSDTLVVEKIKAELMEISKIPTADIDPKKEIMPMVNQFMQSLAKRQEKNKEFLRKYDYWVSDEAYTSKFVPFANLPEGTKTLKQDAALLVLKYFNSINDKCKKAESLLMGQISLLVDRGNYHVDDTDSTLMLKREQIRMMDVSGKAVGMTIDAISMAESRMKEQATNMEKLKKMVSQQAVRGAYLENYSKNQGKDLMLLKQEINRLNALLLTRDEEHKKENKQILDQLVEKSKKLGDEMIINTRLRTEIAQLRAEIIQMKELLKGEENIRVTLLNSQGDAALDDLVEQNKMANREIAELKKEVEVLKSKEIHKEHDQAIKAFTAELNRLQPAKESITQEKLPSIPITSPSIVTTPATLPHKPKEPLSAAATPPSANNKSSNKVYPEPASEAPIVKTEKVKTGGKCIVM